jgi:hypothetical protein
MRYHHEGRFGPRLATAKALINLDALTRGAQLLPDLWDMLIEVVVEVELLPFLAFVQYGHFNHGDSFQDVDA